MDLAAGMGSVGTGSVGSTRPAAGEGTDIRAGAGVVL